MKIRTLAVAAAVAAAGLTATPAQASGVAVCEPPAGAPAIQGHGSWTPAVTALPTAHQWSMELAADCTTPGGFGSDVGSYQISLAGTSTETCTAGNGSGSVGGSGPHGGISGSISWYKVGIHYYMSGSFTSGGHNHSLTLWIDVLPAAGEACAYGSAPVIGHGAVYGHAPVVQYTVGDAEGCHLHAAAEPNTTGQNSEGVVTGRATVAAAETVSIRCYIVVNGAVVASTPTGSGTGTATTAGRVGYNAAETDVVELCSEVTTSHGTDHACNAVTTAQAPPQVIIDLLDAIA